MHTQLLIHLPTARAGLGQGWELGGRSPTAGAIIGASHGLQYQEFLKGQTQNQTQAPTAAWGAGALPGILPARPDARPLGLLERVKQSRMSVCLLGLAFVQHTGLNVLFLPLLLRPVHRHLKQQCCCFSFLLVFLGF